MEDFASCTLALWPSSEFCLVVPPLSCIWDVTLHLRAPGVVVQMPYKVFKMHSKGLNILRPEFTDNEGDDE